MEEFMPHIRLSKEQAAPHVLLPGDPQRLDRIAECLEDVKELAYNREYRSLRGVYKGVPVMAVSTGIGGASAAIGGRAGENRRQEHDTDRKLRRFTKGNPAGGLNPGEWGRAG